MRRGVRGRGAVCLVVAVLMAGCTGGTSGPSAGRSAAPRPSATAASPQARPSPPATVARPFTLVGAGDVLAHNTIISQARGDAGGKGYTIGRMLAGVRPVISGADVAICHMETVYGRRGGPYTGWPLFKAPPQFARDLKNAGYDSCSTASNHTLDDGFAGAKRTLDEMDAVGLAHTGSYRSAADARSPAMLRAGDALVAQLSYTYGTNGLPLPAGKPWTVNLIDVPKIIEDARAARAAGADVVVVSVHWGTEWQEEPDALQRRVAERLTRSRSGGRPDIDLILGTHAHVPQAYQKLHGVWVVFGMGDQIAGPMNDERGNWGTIARFTFSPPAAPGGQWLVTKAEFVPQIIDLHRPGNPRVLNLAVDTAGGRLARVRDRIRAVTLSRGAAEDGLTMGS
ncbi:CapA family protein [Streptomyces sp. NPDC051940]|uniref:CapA family protein n=1 Tax=Streptomyces sp. NPDC051940 TaxID=3155675 RepID=UPI00341A5CB8